MLQASRTIQYPTPLSDSKKAKRGRKVQTSLFPGSAQRSAAMGNWWHPRLHGMRAPGKRGPTTALSVNLGISFKWDLEGFSTGCQVAFGFKREVEGSFKGASGCFWVDIKPV